MIDLHAMVLAHLLVMTSGDGFCHYDYAEPLDVPERLRGKACAIVLDPPHLNLNVMRMYAITCKALQAVNCMYMINTAAANGANVILALSEIGVTLQETSFRPGHRRDLRNEFRCYTNMHADQLVKQIV